MTPLAGMPPLRRCALLAMLAGLLVPLTPQAQELRISGLLPFENASSGASTPVVNDDTLEIPLADRSLRVSPWPGYLPQQFGAQEVEAQRQPRPAGPSDRISMRRADSRNPWLVIAAGARQSMPVVGGWRLQHNAKGWSLSRGTKLHFLGKDRDDARAVRLPDGMDRWCLHLLDASRPDPALGAAREDEAQAAWAAVKLEAGQRCTGGDTRRQPSWPKAGGRAGGAS